MAGWIVAAILGVVLILMIPLYRRSVKEVTDVLTFTLFMLLNENVYRFHSEGLKELIKNTPATNAVDLNLKIRTATTRLSAQLADKITLGCHAAIWNARQDQGAETTPNN